MSSYSFDVIKKMAFQREIEHIKNSKYSNEKVDHLIIIQYMSDRIKEIDKEYDDEPIRD